MPSGFKVQGSRFRVQGSGAGCGRAGVVAALQFIAVSVCPSCAADLSDGARFCAACGVALSDPETTVDPDLTRADADLTIASRVAATVTRRGGAALSSSSTTSGFLTSSSGMHGRFEPGT